MFLLNDGRIDKGCDLWAKEGRRERYGALVLSGEEFEEEFVKGAFVF